MKMLTKMSVITQEHPFCPFFMRYLKEVEREVLVFRAQG